jgi:hypothetical protein
MSTGSKEVGQLVTKDKKKEEILAKSFKKQTKKNVFSD